jgi:hypothetical protein
MLDKRWKLVRGGLLLYGFSLILGLLYLALVTAIAYLGVVELPPLLVTCGSVILSLFGAVGVVLFATVPSESQARVPAIIAAICAVGRIFADAAILLPLDAISIGLQVGFATMVGLVAQLASLIAFLAMLRAVRAIGLYIRDDAIYDRASSLSMALAIFLVLSLVNACFTVAAPAIGTLIMLFIIGGVVLIGFLYVLLVLKTASAIKAMMPG